jgi:hypothetical protein
MPPPHTSASGIPKEGCCRQPTCRQEVAGYRSQYTQRVNTRGGDMCHPCTSAVSGLFHSVAARAASSCCWGACTLAPGMHEGSPGCINTLVLIHCCMGIMVCCCFAEFLETPPPACRHKVLEGSHMSGYSAKNISSHGHVSGHVFMHQQTCPKMDMTAASVLSRSCVRHLLFFVNVQDHPHHTSTAGHPEPPNRSLHYQLPTAHIYGQMWTL